jgi:hypothetical protein
LNIWSVGVILQVIALKLESHVATMDIVVASGHKVKGMKHKICLKIFAAYKNYLPWHPKTSEMSIRAVHSYGKLEICFAVC